MVSLPFALGSLSAARAVLARNPGTAEPTASRLVPPRVRVRKSRRVNISRSPKRGMSATKSPTVVTVGLGHRLPQLVIRQAHQGVQRLAGLLLERRRLQLLRRDRLLHPEEPLIALVAR